MCTSTIVCELGKWIESDLLIATFDQHFDMVRDVSKKPNIAHLHRRLRRSNRTCYYFLYCTVIV